MDKNEANFIRQSFNAFGEIVMAEIARHPGGTIDEFDAELVKQLINAVRAKARSGLRIAHYEQGMIWGKEKVYWINGALNLILWIRNRKFRPKVSEITEEALKLGLIDEQPFDAETHVIEQRKVITAPEDFQVRALGAKNGFFGMPIAPIPATMPGWMDSFPSRGNEEEDRILVNCLLHMSEEKAMETINDIIKIRLETTRVQTEHGKNSAINQKKKQEAEQKRAGAEVVLKAIYRMKERV